MAPRGYLTAPSSVITRHAPIVNRFCVTQRPVCLCRHSVFQKLGIRFLAIELGGQLIEKARVQFFAEQAVDRRSGCIWAGDRGGQSAADFEEQFLAGSARKVLVDGNHEGQSE